VPPRARVAGVPARVGGAGGAERVGDDELLERWR
jgi:hypothetical protein